jgi:hypothetical protein
LVIDEDSEYELVIDEDFENEWIDYWSVALFCSFVIEFKEIYPHNCFRLWFIDNNRKVMGKYSNNGFHVYIYL